MNLWPLLGVLVIVVGFALRLRPVPVVVAAGLTAGLAAGLPFLRILELFGEAFLKNRFLLLFVLTLPVVGLLERRGLREFAQGAVLRLKTATPGRLLMIYQVLRQGTSALGLTSLGGHPQTVRPLVAPMAEAAAEQLAGGLESAERQRIRAMAAGTDNVALFFGEDLFLAFGAVLLMQGVLKDHGIGREPLQIALWGLPTAACALLVHGWRLRRLDARLRRP
jgi:uncharacterized membrane protein